VLKEYRILKLFFLFLFFLPLSGCTTSGMGGAHELEDITPGEKPTIESYEGGVWYQIDKLEEAIKSKAALGGEMRLDDPKLEEYIRKVVCKVAGDHCKDIRTYIMNAPHFNAGMFPNGLMLVNTGFLLRIQSEAQLAAVLGHEVGHYVKRHGMKRQLDKKAKTDLANIIFTITIGTVPMTGENMRNLYDLIAMITYGSIQAFSRNHEREADRFGLEGMAKAGYELDAAAKNWEWLIKEMEMHGHSTSAGYYASHPSSPERVKNLREHAKTLKQSEFPITNEDVYYQNISSHIGDWLEGVVSLKNFKSTEYIIDTWYSKKKNLAELDYYKGEIYFARNKDDDLEKAIKHYEKSINQNPDFYLPYRRLGLIYYKKKDKKYKEYFRKYVMFKPDAKDRSMIESYINE